ncbi:MAG: BRO family protein [Smithella sp.]|jgi:DNA-damage-inducible protein D
MADMDYPTEVFHFDEGKVSFDSLGHENSIKYWYANDFMKMLGYDGYSTFKNVLNRAIAACTTLNINVAENFIQVKREIDGRELLDFKLSRFACYLVAMNGDPKKENVAKAQLYFVCLAESFRNYIEESNNVERMLGREELSGREKSLSGVAQQHGVACYAFFQNAGYRGMYNKNLKELKAMKGLQDFGRSLLDFMGKEELAGNWFRITQTEAKIKKDGIYGQNPLEEVAEKVGAQVRKAMMDISGTRPEDLPLEEDLKTVKKSLKDTPRKFKKIDKK